MSKTNNRRLRAQVRALTAKVAALDGGFQILATCCRCAYCDEVLLSEREELLTHAKVCPQHPCRPLEQEIERQRKLAAALGEKFSALGISWLADGRLVDDSNHEITGFTTAPAEGEADHAG